MLLKSRPYVYVEQGMRKSTRFAAFFVLSGDHGGETGIRTLDMLSYLPSIVRKCVWAVGAASTAAPKQAETGAHLPNCSDLAREVHPVFRRPAEIPLMVAPMAASNSADVSALRLRRSIST
jgi:hypothetical protein